MVVVVAVLAAWLLLLLVVVVVIVLVGGVAIAVVVVAVAEVVDAVSVLFAILFFSDSSLIAKCELLMMGVPVNTGWRLFIEIGYLGRALSVYL